MSSVTWRGHRSRTGQRTQQGVLYLLAAPRDLCLDSLRPDSGQDPRLGGSVWPMTWDLRPAGGRQPAAAGRGRKS